MRLLLPSPTHPAPGLLAGGLALLLLAGCGDCGDDDVPHYTLTPAERAWLDPYPKDAVLRFRSDRTGYERTYRVTETKLYSQGYSGKGLCNVYQQEWGDVALTRTDSSGAALRYPMCSLALKSTNGDKPVTATLYWGPSYAEIPIAGVESGQVQPGPALLGGRTFQQVVVLNASPSTSPVLTPHSLTTLYLSKAEGVVGFGERNGTFWTRR